MKRTLCTLAILAMTIVPLSASEWMGSLQYTNAGSPIGFTATLKGGKGVAVTEDGGRFHVTRDGNKLVISGKDTKGRGTVKNGQTSGQFQRGGFKGTFTGHRK